MIFRNWELIADKEYTKDVYGKIEGGMADGCECNYCKNFISNRENIFSVEIKTLLSQLGVDYNKESDNMHCEKLKNGLHLYLILFHFKGEIKNLQIDNNYIPLDENLDINFGPPKGEIFFPNRENLSQVEFFIKIPWTIEKELEGQ